MNITYSEYTTKYELVLQQFIENLQDIIVSLDSQERVIRDENFGSHYTQKILEKISKQEGIIYLALDDEKVVGFVVAVILERKEEDNLQLKPAKYGEIEKLFTLASYRGSGIGSQLLKMAEEYLIEKEKCDYIEIVVFGDNRKAYDLYKKLGYSDREFVLIKKVN